jgi:alpha-amylase/alpha-mannosidase (GH57 family)
MPAIRILFLWHMHQPFYKDLATLRYRLPWVRLHALKDYYGMVKLLEEFPGVHQTFNLVPSLLVQLEDHARGTAHDPLFEVVAKPAADLTQEERSLAVQYLFQANVANLIARHPRYFELYQVYSAYPHHPEEAARRFTTQDFADLQILSQLAWFDESFLQDPELAALIGKGRDFDRDDQRLMIQRQQQILASVIPAYRQAAGDRRIEISTSPFYHPILPLLCDTGLGAVSSPGLTSPSRRFAYPEDAAEQLSRGLALHERIFGLRPAGVWPSEGAVSDEVLAIAHRLGVQWMATGEGVLGRTLGTQFRRQEEAVLTAAGAGTLYDLYRYRTDEASMYLLFRDQALSDLIGFVYSGMPAKEAALHFIQRLKKSAQPVLDAGKDAIVPIILDGENAWEYFPASGRDFLRHLYATLQSDPVLEPLTVSEAIARHPSTGFAPLERITPGSWIDANFNIWIGAEEDNLAWDHLTAARDHYAERAPHVPREKRELAYEELLIAEGSDWNWWYGPEHSTANDSDFDDLYRKHLTNVYHALGVSPPDVLAQRIRRLTQPTRLVPQTAYIHPRVDGEPVGFFDWFGAARCQADGRGASMHGRRVFLESAYAGINERYLFGRLDFMPWMKTSTAHGRPHLRGEHEILQSIECLDREGRRREPPVTLRIHVRHGEKESWMLEPGDDPRLMAHRPDLLVQLGSVLETRIALDFLQARIGDTLRVRFSLWHHKLPVDALPGEGALVVRVLTEARLAEWAEREEWKA